MEDFRVEINILLRLVIFGPYGRGDKVGKKSNNISSVTTVGMYPILTP